MTTYAKVNAASVSRALSKMNFERYNGKTGFIVESDYGFITATNYSDASSSTMIDELIAAGYDISVLVDALKPNGSKVQQVRVVAKQVA